MKKHLLAGLAFVGACVSAPASATVAAGDIVTCGGVSLECSNDRATVGSGVEFGIDFSDLGTLFTADFSAGLLTLFWANNPEVGDVGEFGEPFSLTFSNETNPFTFAELGDVNGVEGVDGSTVSLDGGFLTINLSNTTFAPDSSLQVKFDRTTTPPAGPVPEPATWAMMILGFGLVGAAMRKRASATVQPLFA
ncbi:MAG: PEPxxWA-CTERM sorting domain-containing protein [Sphingomonas phyllosphaerae]